jgi:hypothetical protein
LGTPNHSKEKMYFDIENNLYSIMAQRQIIRELINTVDFSWDV